MKITKSKYFKPIVILAAAASAAALLLVLILLFIKDEGKIITGNQAAVITVNNDEVDMFPKSIFTVKPSLRLGGIEKTDVTYEWGSADESIAVVENGKITAVGVGTTTITVSAPEYEHTEKEITVYVRDDYTLDLSEWELYLGVVELFGYQNTVEVTITAKKEGKVVDSPDIRVEMDAAVATYTQDGEMINVTAAAKGENNAVVTWEYEGRIIYTELPITVVKPRTTAKESYWFSVSDIRDMSIDLSYVKADLPKGTKASEAVGVTDEDGNSFTTSAKGNRIILSGDAGYKDRGEEHTLVMEFEVFELVLPIQCATLAIRTTDDFFSLPGYYDSDTKAIDGLYVLCNDLDFAGEAGFDTFCGYRQNGGKTGGYIGWIGTFDGQGHVIRNLILNDNSDHGGIFGSLGVNGVVKNVAFANGTNNANGGYLFNYIYGTVENVFVASSVTKGVNAESPAAVLTQRIVYNTAKLSNITVAALNELTGYNYTLTGSISEELFKTVITGTTVSLGAAESQVVPIYKTATEMTKANANVKVYFGDTAAQAVKLSTNGSTSFTEKNDILYVYYNGTIVYAKSLKKDAEIYDYSLSKGTIDFGFINGISAADIKGITHLDGTKLNYTINGHIATISGDPILNADPKSASGSVTTVLVKTAKGNVQLSLRLVTLAIRTTEDFYSLPTFYDTGKKAIEGYYVLSNDLDFAKKAGFDTFCGYRQNGGKTGGYIGWIGTFDGQGHVIRNLVLNGNSDHGGIFGSLGVNGVVKNVAFANGTNNANGGYLFNYIYGTVENVFVASSVTKGVNAGSPAAVLTQRIVYNTAKLNNVTVASLNELTGHNYTLAGSISEELFKTVITGTTVSLGVAESQTVPIYKTAAEMARANANVKVYSADTAAQATKLSNNGSAVFADKNGIFYVYYNGAIVYAKNIRKNTEVYDYSLSNGVIDFDLVNSVSFDDITGIKHLDGTKIAYTVNGHTVTINSDAILNADPKSASGSIVTVLVQTAKGDVPLSLRVVTLAIRTTDDFYRLPTFYDMEKKAIEGYYVLSNDLDFAKKAGFDTFCGYRQNGGKTGGYIGWIGTFDGQGHVIRNLVLNGNSDHGGIFGSLGVNGVVKNVSFANGTNNASGGYLFNYIYGTVENVFVASSVTKGVNAGSPAAVLTQRIVYNTAKLNNVTIIALNELTGFNYTLAGSISEELFKTVITGTTVSLGVAESQVVPIYETAAEMAKSNPNVKVYSTENVAQAAELSNSGSTTFVEKNEIFYVYYNGTAVYAKNLQKDTEVYDYSLSNRVINFELVNSVNASDITGIIHLDGTKIAYTMNGETVSIRDDAVLTEEPKSASGSIATVLVQTAKGDVPLALRMVTLAIRTTDDFYSLPDYLENKTVEGYFVLCNDLDFAGKKEFATYCGASQLGSGGGVGWNAIFDGQNHVIHNLALSKAWNNGIFGTIGFGGVVRNVAFTGAENKGYGGYVCDDIYGTVENIYVEGVASQTNYDKIGNDTGCLFANNIGYANATIQNITVVATGSWIDKNRALAAAGTAVDDNVVVIGAAENQILGSYTTIADIRTANAKINAFATVAEAAKANLSANGSASFKTENGSFYTYFGETCVYQEEIKIELVAYDYSLSKGAIDFSLIESLSAADITAMEHENGTAINYTVSGETVTIDGDTILNADGKTATGAVTAIVVKTAFAKYRMPLRVVTLAIRTTDDFYTLPNYLENRKVEGYFVLCNDLDFAGNEFVTYCGASQVGSGGSVGWNAVFDGQNHIIRNLALSRAWNNGIFGTVGFGGAVRNVAFTGADNKGYGGYVCDDIYGTVENIYVEGVASQTAYGENKFGNETGCLFANKFDYLPATIKNITVVATGNWTNKNRALGATGTAIDDSAVVIGAAENQILGRYTTIADIQTANAKIKAFVTAKAAAEACLPTNGSTAFTSEEGVLKISWNGKTTYSTSIK